MSWKVKSSGVFGKSKVLSVEAVKALRKGEALTMDYGPDKLDNTLLLDYGVLDTYSAKVGWGHVLNCASVPLATGLSTMCAVAQAHPIARVFSGVFRSDAVACHNISW